MRPLARAATELAIAGVCAVAAATQATIHAANYGGGQSGDLPLVNVAMVALLLLLPMTHGFTTLILPPLARRANCGTPAAAARHRQHGEPVDHLCRLAESLYRASLRAKRKERANA